MLQKGNKKLGREIYCFSIPPHLSCTNATECCKSVCYAKKGYFRMGNVKCSQMSNWEMVQRKDFAERMIAEIGRKKVKILRIHVAGDYFSAWYIRQWIKIAKACPGVRFYGTTRAWRDSKLLPHLQAFAGLSNVTLWWSADRDTHKLNGAPMAVPGIRVVYMQMDDDDSVPEYSNLVLRVKRKLVKKTVNGVRVCPTENGIEYDSKPTCSGCKFCFKANRSAAKRSAGVLR